MEALRKHALFSAIYLKQLAESRCLDKLLRIYFNYKSVQFCYHLENGGQKDYKYIRIVTLYSIPCFISFQCVG